MLPIDFSVTGVFKRSRSENSPLSHALQYIYAPFFHDRHPEPCIIRSFSPPKSFASFCVIDVGFIKALLRRVTSCRHQLIIQEVDVGKTLSVLWSLHASMASFSLPVTGLHQWPSTERFCMVFDIGSYIQTTWTVLPWGSLSLSVIPLAPVNNLHYWLVIRRCLSMFDSRTFFHVDRLVLRVKIERVLKTPDLVSSIRATIYSGI